MKKTLTTLSVAALLAAGGIAVAQTAPYGTAPATDMSSSATIDNSTTGDLGSTAGAGDMSNTDTSTLGAGSDTATLGSDTGTFDANADPIARADRG